MDGEDIEYDEEPLTEEDKSAIEESLREIARGEVYTLEEGMEGLRRRDNQT